MVNVLKDIKTGLRSLIKGRGVTLVAILALSLAIGANAAIFSMVDAIIFRPFPFKDLGRLVALFDTIPRTSAERDPVSPANYFDWRRQNHVFERMDAYRSEEWSLTGARDPERVLGCRVSAGFFGTLGMQAAKGITFPETIEDRPDQIVVSQGFWLQRLNGDPKAVGRVISLDGRGHTVIGIMPKDFDFPHATQIWAPWIPTTEEKNERDRQQLGVVAKLKPDAAISQAQAEMTIIGEQLAARYPLIERGHSVRVVPMRETADPYAPRFITIVMAAAAFLLLLACANVANLQLARGTARKKEMAIRMSLGASRGRLIRLVLVEGTLLSIIAAAIGLPCATLGLSIIRASIPPTVAEAIPSVMHSTLDSRMLLFTMLVALAAGIAFSLPAALQFSASRLHESLRDAGKGSSFSGRRRIGEAMVISEIALAVVLLIGAGLMLRGFRNLANIRQGFNSSDVLTFNVSLLPSKYPENYQVENFYKESLRRLGDVSGVESSGLISDLPALGDSRASTVVIEGQPLQSFDRPWLAEVRVISPEYFRTMEIPVRAGRIFAPDDNAASLPVAIISASASRRFWQGQDAIGKRIRLNSPDWNTSWLTVVGVVGDVNHFFLDTEIRPTVYLSYMQASRRSLHFVVRSSSRVSATTAVAGVRSAVVATDAAERLYDLKAINTYYSDLAGGVGVVAGLMETFAFLALILSAAGIFALMAYSVAQRTHEIGVRIALGAQRQNIRQLILKNALKLILAGLLVGIPSAVALSLTMSAVLPALVALEPLTFIGFTALLGTVALAACYVPLRRATRVDPIIALRY